MMEEAGNAGTNSLNQESTRGPLAVAKESNASRITRRLSKALE
jgi:hypothetical protein